MLNFKLPNDLRRSERDILWFELKSRWTKDDKSLNALSEIFLISLSARMRYASLSSDTLWNVFAVIIFRWLPINSKISVLPGNFGMWSRYCPWFLHIAFMSLHVHRATGHNSFDWIITVTRVVPLNSKNKRITPNCIIMTLNSEYEVIGWTHQWDWSVNNLLSYFPI